MFPVHGKKIQERPQWTQAIRAEIASGFGFLDVNGRHVFDDTESRDLSLQRA
jgi:hypothetical protein